MARIEGQVTSEKFVGELREALASVLDVLSAGMGDPRFASAAALLRGGLPGRKSIDDSRALAVMERLIESKTSRSVENAAMSVAVTLRGEHSPDAAKARLARKFRERKRNTTD